MLYIAKRTVCVAKMLYKLLWLLVQTCITLNEYLKHILRTCITLYEYIKQLTRCLETFDNKSYDRQNEYTEIANYENNFLDDCKTQISKLPRHLSLIIGPNEGIDEELITRILGYALYMRIDCISFYDTRLSDKQRIRLCNLKKLRGVLSTKVTERHMLWIVSNKSNDTQVPKQNGTTNGYSNTKKGYRNGFNTEQSIEVYEIESDLGQKLIADVCRELFVKRKSEEVQELIQNRTLGERIDKDLSKRLYKCTDPELCIIFSKQMCTFGALPWNTRFTEFYLHHTDDPFNAKTFAKILFQYSRCEQRWGK